MEVSGGQWSFVELCHCASGSDYQVVVGRYAQIDIAGEREVGGGDQFQRVVERYEVKDGVELMVAVRAASAYVQ